MPDRVPHRTDRYPDVQHQGVDWSAIMQRQSTIHGLFEFDVTATRQAIHEFRRRTGEPLSFTALIVAEFAHAIGEDPRLQAYRKGKRKLVVFEDVDVAVLVEHLVEGELIPMPHIVRAANRKTPAQIDGEIRAARAEADPYRSARRFARPWLALPAFLRRFLIARFLADPMRRKRFTGTAAVTAVGMFGSGSGWGVPFVSHSICLTVGGLARKPGLDAAGKIAVRDTVSLTLSLDHDVVNGAPAARFVSRLRDGVERASLLR